jgi:hypothetical protein
MITENTQYVRESYIEARLSLGRHTIKKLCAEGSLTPKRISERIVLYPMDEVAKLEDKIRSAQPVFKE